MSDEVTALSRRAALVALQAASDGLDPSTAVMAAAIEVCFPGMTNVDIADWMRRTADELDRQPTKEKHQ